MTWWQVQADMLTGGQMVFGVRADDRETAQVEVLRRLYGTGAAGVQMTELPSLPERWPDPAGG